MSETERSLLISSDSGNADHMYVTMSDSGKQSEKKGLREYVVSGTYPYITSSYDERVQRSVKHDLIDPIHLSWEDVNVYVNMEKKGWFGSKSKEKYIQRKHILRNMTGMVKPGTLLSIIGASGAGKSTLMNILTGRNVAQYSMHGSIKVNGVKLEKEIRNISAYCQQDEMFIGTLTVREHLKFRALLRMDKILTKEVRLQRVEETIVEMGLSSCANTRIGIPGKTKGISGGEMKRLSFASEVLTNPSLMFCDEPTSGLDSFMAQNVVQTLQSMASKGRTILCTIHQPSSEVFAMFQEVLILAEGRTAFMGPSDEAFKFFGNQGYSCPQNFNPADFYILSMAIVPGKEAQCRNKVERVCDAFSESDTYHKLAMNINEVTSKRSPAAASVLFEEAFAGDIDRYQTSWVKQFGTVFWRSWINLIRNAVLLRIRVIQTIAVAVVLGLIYLNQEYDEVGVMNINGAIFLLTLNASFTNMFSVLRSFPIEAYIFLREYGSGLYRVDVYYLAKTIAELPTFIIFPFLSIAILYWMIGLYNDAVTFFICVGVIVFVTNVAVSLGYLLSTLSSSVEVALVVGRPLMFVFMLFGGLFLNSGSIPDYFLWLKYISWFQYANEVLSVNQWKNVKNIKCSADAGNTTSHSQRCYRDGEEVLDYLSYSEDNVILDLWLMAALLVGYRILSFLALLVRARRSKS